MEDHAARKPLEEPTLDASSRCSEEHSIFLRDELQGRADRNGCIPQQAARSGCFRRHPFTLAPCLPVRFDAFASLSCNRLTFPKRKLFPRVSRGTSFPPLHRQRLNEYFRFD